MKKIIIFFFLSLLLASCKDWLDVNTDPNAPASVTLEQMYPSGVASDVAVIGGYYAMLGGFWSQYLTQSTSSNQYKYVDSYNLTNSNFNREYTELYSGALNSYKFVREQAEKNQNWSYFLMATVMDAYTWQVLVDLYDNIPFSEANRGALVLSGSSSDVLSPHYEKGQDIYDSLISRIDVAMSKDLHNTVSGVATSADPGFNDFIFGTDLSLSFDERMNLWKQFANTLKLKIYMRECYARPSVTQAGIQSMVSRTGFEGFLSTSAVFTQFKDEADKDNPFYESNIRALNTSDNVKASQTTVGFLLDIGDSLILPHLYSKVSGNFVGLDQGDFTNTSRPGSSLSTFLQSPVDPVYFVSTAESYFLQAEAVLRGYMAGDVKTLYDNGVLASFSQWGEKGGPYIKTGAPFAYPAGSFEDNLKAIITQKWLSMAGLHGLEAFFEFNRTHYPDILVPSRNAVTPNHQFPKRLLLPETEKERNKNAPTDNAPVYQKVWWDVNP